jgi:DNA-binding NarL/FixJ family response regulator
MPTRTDRRVDFTNGVVLVVDDAPETLALLCESLADAGYMVLVARSGEEALERLKLAVPDAILLDAVMPGLAGFETCRRIKAEPALSHIPVVFMTGLSETSHLVEGFAAGGVDYVVKPARAEEVLARLATHMRNARTARLAREAVDIGGHGVLMIDARGRIAWRSPQAEAWLRQFFPEHGGTPPASWIETATRAVSAGAAPEFRVERESVALVGRAVGSVGLGEFMLLLELRSCASLERRTSAPLTGREAEVLSWLAKGKTNRDIADILGMSPRTVNKHLEHIFEKLGVETRTAAAALVHQTPPRRSLEPLPASPPP